MFRLFYDQSIIGRVPAADEQPGDHSNPPAGISQNVCRGEPTGKFRDSTINEPGLFVPFISMILVKQKEGKTFYRIIQL